MEVHVEDLLAPLDVGFVHLDLPVEPAPGVEGERWGRDVGEMREGARWGRESDEQMPVAPSRARES